MQTPVRFILVCGGTFFLMKIINHSVQVGYKTIFLTNCSIIHTLAIPALAPVANRDTVSGSPCTQLCALSTCQLIN